MANLANDRNPFAFVGEYCFQEPDHLPTPVTSKILVGSVRHATAVPMLRRLGVTHVCNCAAGDCSAPVDQYEEHGIEYTALRAVDAEGYPILRNHLNAVLEFIQPLMARSTMEKGPEDEKRPKVLLHCSAGRNRSVALALAVVMMHEGTPLQNIVRRLFQRRPFILTNQSFRQQLHELAEQQQLLTAPSPLIDASQVDAGHRALVGYACRHCGQPHCIIDEARLDFSISVDCSTFTVGELMELIEEKLGCEPRVEFETLTEANAKGIAVSCVGYADAALGRADSLVTSLGP